MTTPSHDSVVDSFVQTGYRKQDFHEFLRLVHYADSELRTDCSDNLLAAFSGGGRLRFENAIKIAGTLTGDKGEYYRDVRRELPTPPCVPDAWAYQKSKVRPDRMEVHIVEATNFCPPGMHKLLEYGLTSDELESCFLRVTEVNARTLAVTEHDPLLAMSIMMKPEYRGLASDDKKLKQAEALYIERLMNGEMLAG